MKKDHVFTILMIFVVLAVLSMSIGYAAFNTELSITGEAYVRVDESIRINSIKVKSMTNGVYETYNCEYSKATTSMFVTLPSNGSITYEVTIMNNTGKKNIVADIIEGANSNKNVTYKIVGLAKDDIIDSELTTFTIVISNNTNQIQEESLVLEYEFLEYIQQECVAGLEWTFDYTGNEQEFVVPCDGEYKIEVWGAQGGNANNTYIGGYGGYSQGNIKLEKSTPLYINIGGQGKSGTPDYTILGGYNGGGSVNRFINDSNSTNRIVAGGGGATHIASSTGLLSELANKKDDILIVAGGGGGGYYHSAGSPHVGKGGSGGGMEGLNGAGNGDIGVGGTQTTAGSNASFGQGGSVETNAHGSAGGGGLYGGGGSLGIASQSNSSGGGGSGYIENNNLFDKAMYCYDCKESNEENTKTISTTNVSAAPISNYAKIGNGYTKITYLGNLKAITITFDAKGGNITTTSKEVRYGETYGELPTPTKIYNRFMGWYTDTTYTTQVTSTSKVEITEDQTLYAKWEIAINGYAVKREINSESSAWDRIGYSIGKEANAQIGTTTVKNDFDNIYPWSEIKSYNYDTGTKKITAWYGESGFTFTPTGNIEVLTYIPEFYYARYQIEDYEYIAISDYAQEGFTKSDAFSIGRYTMSGNSTRVHSRSGNTPLVSTTITNFRNYAKALGSGFGQLDYHYFVLQLLYLVEYADYNSQAKLGQGNTNNTAPITSGGCNSLGMHSGSITNDGKHSVIYRGIEDIFGNIWQFIDGINIKDHQTYINYNPATYEVDKYDGDYKKIGYINSKIDGYISTLGYDAENQLVALPIEVLGTDSTYVTDFYYQGSGNLIPIVGGCYGSALNYSGMLLWNMNYKSVNNGYHLGARLLKIG